MGMWDNIKSFVSGNDDEDNVPSPKTKAIRMMAYDNPGKPSGKITTKDIYKQRHRMNKKKKRGEYYGE